MSFHIRVSARGIVIHENKILMNEFGSGEYYNIPGGGVEQGETLREAAAREIFEESGLEVTVGDLVYVLEYEPSKCGFVYGSNAHLSIVFRCYLKGSDVIKMPSVPDIDPNNPGITSEARWISIADLKNIHYVPYIHEQLVDYISTGEFKPIFIEELLERKKM